MDGNGRWATQSGLPDEVESIFWLMRAYPRLETERLRQHGARHDPDGPARLCWIAASANFKSSIASKILKLI
jgi:hypothetical protein